MRRATAIVAFALAATAAADTFDSAWVDDVDRIWVGPSYWANRLQDWRIADGWLTCVDDAAQPLRTVHLLTHRLSERNDSSQSSVEIDFDGDRRDLAPDAFGGLMLGAGGATMDHRGAAVIHGISGRGNGFLVGLRADGRVFIHDLEQPLPIDTDEPPGSLPRDTWTIAGADSDEPGQPALNAIDDDATTIWHTAWRERRDEHPHEIIIDTNAPSTFDGLACLPRQDSSSGRVLAYRIFVGDAPDACDTLVASGVFEDGAARQDVTFDRVTARCVRFVADSAPGGRPATAIAELFLVDSALIDRAPQDRAPEGSARLRVSVKRIAPETVLIDAIALAADGRRVLDRVNAFVTADRMIGTLALVSHPGAASRGRPGRARFRDWHVTGPDIDAHPADALGPILSAQYTLSRRVLKVTAQCMPLGARDGATAALETFDGTTWRRAAEVPIITPGWTATFRIEDWDDTRDTPYRIVHDTTNRRGGAVRSTYEGVIRHDPVERDVIVLAALSCNHNNSHNLAGGWGATDGSKIGDWPGLLWFPHADLTARVSAHAPDLLFFAGDQIYEGASPSFADRRHLELDYLYKWYLWCWAYRDLTRSTPAVVIPDDHDVYQGNVWGAGGRAARRQEEGGYVQPAEFIRMVVRTQTSHLPDPFDPTPIEQDLPVYYTDLVWGRVSFAVLEDRTFKSGCLDPALPPSGTGRPDHFNDPDFDTRNLDLPHLRLLGDRQLAFLDAWARDWRGADLKAALSQTVFANLATHHGKGLQSLIADLDSNGWPQTGRNQAVAALRRALAPHIAGDQHLATLARHGIEAHRDAGWSFCMPAAANFYPRQWLPPRDGANRAPGEPPWLGDHVDGFGNLVTMVAVANPRASGHEPRDLHDGMAGYGIVRFDRPGRSVTFECWPRWAGPSDDAQQFPGWPVTVAQRDGDGRPALGPLPEIVLRGLADPVVRVTDETTGELIVAFRARGDVLRLPAITAGPFTIDVGDPDRDWWQTLTGVRPGADRIELIFPPRNDAPNR
ncbi:MAG: discoidin domain-containing protein [Phycisphaerales bacterium]|nr:discoidin domain-containing protein [Phycisphaerales bacterium]